MQKIYCTINRVGNETKIMSVVCVHVSGWPIVIMNGGSWALVSAISFPSWPELSTFSLA